MEAMTQVSGHVFRLQIPYKDIFTTVYVVKTQQGALLFDTADSDRDVEERIIPMLDELGVTPRDLKCIFISHNHRDHAGGLKTLLERYPDVCIVSRSQALADTYKDYSFVAPEENDVLLDVFRVVTIPGHTADSMALLDTRTKTLITGDCLQLYGIFGSTDWACAIALPAEHLRAVEKLRAMDIECILTAHDYHPYGWQYKGREAVALALDACVAPLLQIRDLLREDPGQDDAAVRQRFNALDKRPTVNVRVVAAMRKALDEGRL